PPPAPLPSIHFSPLVTIHGSRVTSVQILTRSGSAGVGESLAVTGDPGRCLPFRQGHSGQVGAIYCTHFSPFERQHFGEDDSVWSTAVGGAGRKLVVLWGGHHEGAGKRAGVAYPCWW